MPYVSDGAVCQRILLGAITNRFHEVPAFSDRGGTTATDTDTASMSASMGSVDDAGHRNTMGGALTYASSMTSGDIHMMDVDECKPSSVSMNPTDYHSLRIKPQHALPPGLVVADESRPLGRNIEPAPVSHGRYWAGRYSPKFDGSNSPSIVTSRGPSTNYILDLDDPPQSSPAPLASGARVRKHPATLQCTWCLKKFTRVYNLRTHLRTHSNLDGSNTPSPVTSRDYILDLDDPPRSSHAPPASGARVQKYPAAFECPLCPKKFMRAYNLRSHLGTHSDERPYLCTVCGKAFARQHDRKRHEGLHSGEKKFVCRGELSTISGQTWGCGRHFARADTLGRHFRSEAGQICIKLLLDEEEAERRSETNEGGKQKPILSAGLSAFNFPAALLAQYPALANINWAALEPEKTNVDPGELSDMSDMSDSAQ